MAKIDEFKITFTNQDITCRVRRIPGVNEHYFDWFVSNLPTPETIWTHAIIAGNIGYSHCLEMKHHFPYDYNDSQRNVYLNECEPGVFTMFCGAGKTGMVITKYGPVCTEPMCYPAFAQLAEEDAKKFYEAHIQAWDATYATKMPEPLVRFEL